MSAKAQNLFIYFHNTFVSPDIRNTACLQALQDCKNLRELNLKNNPVEDLPDWRHEVKAILPWLQKLNGENL